MSHLPYISNLKSGDFPENAIFGESVVKQQLLRSGFVGLMVHF